MSKYLKYAIGEILLVVVGILIAFQVNSWNENRKSKAKEQLYLTSFQNDLVKNADELQRVIDKTNRVVNMADTLLKVKNDEVLDFSDRNFTSWIFGSSGFTIYQAKGGTVKSLIASGDLNVVTNDSLRLALATWEDDLSGLKEWEALNKESSREYQGYVDDNLDLFQVDYIDEPISKTMQEQLLNSRMFLNHVSNRRRLSYILNRVYEEQMVQLKALQQRVEEQLQ
ncbi:DUF6090 family protein [Winogradskyella poriferorum]|uniref:DUF6090 family protein n=1 Tax=Winogradskyella poriferorum TaxID=307627 RepID=UPI003D65984D